MGLLNLSKKNNELDILKEGLSDNFTSPLQIRANLEEVCKKNTRLIAVIDERPSTYGSMFLEVGLLIL